MSSRLDLASACGTCTGRVFMSGTAAVSTARCTRRSSRTLRSRPVGVRGGCTLLPPGAVNCSGSQVGSPCRCWADQTRPGGRRAHRGHCCIATEGDCCGVLAAAYRSAGADPRRPDDPRWWQQPDAEKVQRLAAAAKEGGST